LQFPPLAPFFEVRGKFITKTSEIPGNDGLWSQNAASARGEMKQSA
jgi:hypothetical protein